jgi:small subunit ribosomal protein S4
MSRYRGPKLRVIRRLGKLPGLSSKISKKINAPGQHGPAKAKKKLILDYYGIRLQEKQKLRFNYGISEKQLCSYVNKARKLKGSTGLNIIQFLEMRLDNIVYRLGITPTIASARQLVSHGHILTNNKRINIPSFQCRINDKISLTEGSPLHKFKKDPIKKTTLLGTHLSVDKNNSWGKIIALVSHDDLILKINDLLIVEYYSRN